MKDNITISEFITDIVKELHYGDNYTDAISMGIIASDQFNNFEKYITNEEAAVILDAFYVNFYRFSKDDEALLSLISDNVYVNYDYFYDKAIIDIKSDWIERLNRKNVHKYIQCFRKDIQKYILEENYAAVSNIDYLIASMKGKDFFVPCKDIYGNDLYSYYLNLYSESILYCTPSFLSAVRYKDGFDEAYYIKTMSVLIKNNNILTDLNKISDINQDCIYRMYIKGIMNGYSNGLFTKDRFFKPNEYALKEEANLWIRRLTNPKECRIISPDGQLTRTTNLPYNSKDYPYILESFPNDWYSMVRLLTEETADSFTVPDEKEIGVYVTSKNQLNPNYAWSRSKYYNQSFRSQSEELESIKKREYPEVIKDNLELRLNISYNKMDSKWIEQLINTYSILPECTDSIKEYIKIAKKHKVKIKADKIVVEYTGNNGSGYRCYAKFTVSWKGKVKDVNDLVFSYKNKNQLSNLQNGISIETYFDIEVNESGIIYFEDNLYSYDYVKNEGYLRNKPLKLIKITDPNVAYKTFKKIYGKKYADYWKYDYKLTIENGRAIFYWKY